MVCEWTESLVAGKTARIPVKTGGSVLVGHVRTMEAGYCQDAKLEERIWVAPIWECVWESIQLNQAWFGPVSEIKYNVPGTEYLDVSGVQMVNEEQRMYKVCFRSETKRQVPYLR